MALTITHTAPVSGVDLYTYDNIDSDDTSPGVITASGTQSIVGSIQVIGDFGTNASVALQGSNDLTNWVNLKDTEGTEIAITAAGAAEFSTAMVYLRPLVTAGTAEDLDIFIALRG